MTLKVKAQIFFWNFLFVQLQSDSIWLLLLLRGDLELMTWAIPAFDRVRAREVDCETPLNFGNEVSFFEFLVWI